MADPIQIRPADGIWVVRTDGAVIAESTRALALIEGSRAPVIYFPREHVAMSFLDRSASATSCPLKGQASYYSVVGESGTLHDAGWSYEDPTPGAEAIRGHIAFYTDKVTVEQL